MPFACMVSVNPSPKLKVDAPLPLAQMMEVEDILTTFILGVLNCFFIVYCFLLDNLTCNIVSLAILDNHDVAILNKFALACRCLARDVVKTCYASV